MNYMYLVWVISVTPLSSGFWLGSASGASADQREEGEMEIFVPLAPYL